MTRPPSPAAPSVNPSDMIEALLPIWRAVLSKPELGIDDDFFLAGGNSATAAALFARMEEQIGPMPHLSSLQEHSSVRSMAATIDRLRTSLGPEPVAALRATGSRAPLILCPAAVSNVLFVRWLLPYLDEDQPFLAIRARGLEAGETPHDNIEKMASDYIREVKRLRPVGPYIIAGNCAGGYTAYEMARRLWAAGEDVLGIILIDPDVHPNTAPWLYWKNPRAPHILCWRFILRLWWAAKWRLRRQRRRWAGRRRWGSWPYERGVNSPRQHDVVRGFVTALGQYRPLPVDRGIHLLCSSKSRVHFDRQRYGWKTLAPHVEFGEVGDEHEDMFYDNLPALAATLNRLLDRMNGAGAGKRSAE